MIQDIYDIKASQAVCLVLIGEDPWDFARGEQFIHDLVTLSTGLLTSLAEATNEDPLRILQILEEKV